LKYFFKKRSYNDEDRLWSDRVSVICDHLMKEKSCEHALSIGFLGDIMWVRKPDKNLDDELLLRMRKCNWWIGNLETPLVAENKVHSFFPDYLKYGSSCQLIKKFNDRGRNIFGMVSLANNHISDRKDYGIETTLECLNNKGVLYSGINDEGCIKEYENIRVGFYALTFGENYPNPSSNYHVNLFDYSEDCIDRIKLVLAKMDQRGVDLKIISLHWGHEFEFLPTVQQRSFSRELAKCGCDIIIGQHAHVVQPMEVLFLGNYEKTLDLPVKSEFCLPYEKPKKVLVIYSLGNFYTDMFTKETQSGLAVGISIEKEGNKVDWNFKDVFYTDNIRSGIVSPHKISVLK
jgi:poly-gamma-glutamate synthesis protein (capsule biosynthesis protein)